MIDIIYEDNHIIVAYKPKGILSQADGSSHKDMLTLLKEYIKNKYHKDGNVFLGLVHRLDINTSGVMVFARTSKAASRLSSDIKNHQFEKKYYAVVEGILNTSGTIKSYLEKDEEKKKSFISKNGKEAVLDYVVIKTGKISNQVVSLVDIDLKTGRFHQIRAQFASINHPLYGDKKYGSKNVSSYEEFPLEAYHLAFMHPTKREWLVFEKKTLTI